MPCLVYCPMLVLCQSTAHVHVVKNLVLYQTGQAQYQLDIDIKFCMRNLKSILT